MLKVACTLSLAVTLFAVGCYDDGDREDCVGLECPSGFQWPEGGEVRIWSIRTPDGAVIRRYFGFFMSKQTPDVHNTLPEVGRCGRSVDGDQGQNREYYDVGENITFVLDNGEEVVVPKLTADPANPMCMPGTACAQGAMDYYGRIHDVAYLLETITPPPEAAGLVDGFYNSFHSVRTANQMELSDQLDELFVGPSFTVLDPPRNEMGAVTFKRGEDVYFSWENEQPPNPDVVAAAAIVIVPDMSTMATGCISVNDGNFTVPAATIDALEGDTGIMLVGNGADKGLVTDDGRAIHKWGLFCNLIPWTRVD